MTVSGISNGNMQMWQAKMQQGKQDWSHLASALQSGDLASAQQAFADLQSLRPTGRGQQDSATATNGSGKGNDGSTGDFAALSNALQSGNLADAQSAFAKIQADMKAHKGGHHHHHGGSAVTDSQPAGSSGALPDNSTISVSA